MKAANLLLTFVFLVIYTVCQNEVYANNKIPVIRANSDLADVKVDDVLNKQSWKIAPQEELDILEISAKVVTFYTDVDSITFNIDPTVGEYNFIILLNGKDSARTQIKYRIPRLEELKLAAEYGYNDNRFVPEFTYQAADNPNLVRVREELKLDSIAGKGSELSQIFNLMHWLHNLVRHDGSSYNPQSRNAIDIVNICKTENRGVNCRMLATVLNECYLAMGIKSRYITCMPKETKFDDCHVINMVFSKELDKWIWIDPSFNAYVMDENGNLLGIQEVRQRLVNGQPLVLNADANWNRESLMSKEYYLETYMAKNLYRMRTPLKSEYDTESIGAGKVITYVELLPLDGIDQEPQYEQVKYETYQMVYNYYKTNNPDIFWAKPN